ncbi:hypothetical protein ILUMI_01033 [Ignelater luminosus]|uniref:Uncharacterized protein n=1 Tax=Ignelater luminosus TaxID=2038154 RepID=A0A8K0GPM0_IGNLU|nr:hypothetical protein ILUMI_01033 [Ignelater luminosus]
MGILFARGFIFLVVIMDAMKCDEDLNVTETEELQNTESTTSMATKSIVTTITEVSTSSSIEITTLSTDNATEEVGNDTVNFMTEEQTNSNSNNFNQFYEDDDALDSSLETHNETDDFLLTPPISNDDSQDVSARYTETMLFRKCCAKDESFDPRLKCVSKKLIMKQRHLEGEEREVNDIIGKKYPWFPSHIISEVSPVETVTPDRLNLTRVKVRYASRPKCDESKRLILQWYKEDSPFFFILISNGSMVELDRRNMQTVASWPIDSYCLESVPSEYSYHVAILCPCIHLVCIRKCCPRGFYYNTTEDICTQFKGLSREEYKPKFYKGYDISKKNINYYLLRKMPVCAGKKLETLTASQRRASQLYIQQDGSIHIKTIQWHRINNSRYCADIFIDKRGKETTNILYCMRNMKQRSRKTLIQEKTYRKRTVRNKSDKITMSMNFYLLLYSGLDVFKIPSHQASQDTFTLGKLCKLTFGTDIKSAEMESDSSSSLDAFKP